MKLPKITKKQEQILELLYTHRFLNRIQIQALMGHKDKRRIAEWLKDLREKEYVHWIYSTHFLEKTKPAIYYLGINGVRFLRRQTATGNDGEAYDAYPLTEVRKRYKEHERSDGFIARSILIADCCLALQAKTSPSLVYDCYTQAEYSDPNCGFHFLAEHETLSPNLCIISWKYPNNQAKQADQDGKRTSYLLEIFDTTVPRYRLKSRLKYYVDYLINDEWDSSDNDPPPILLLVLPTITDLIYAKRRTKKLLLNEYYDYDDIPKDIHIRFTTTDQLKQHCITASIWEEGRKLYGL